MEGAAQAWNGDVAAEHVRRGGGGGTAARACGLWPGAGGRGCGRWPVDSTKSSIGASRTAHVCRVERSPRPAGPTPPPRGLSEDEAGARKGLEAPRVHSVLPPAAQLARVKSNEQHQYVPRASCLVTRVVRVG